MIYGGPYFDGTGKITRYPTTRIRTTHTEHTALRAGTKGATLALRGRKPAIPGNGCVPLRPGRMILQFLGFYPDRISSGKRTRGKCILLEKIRKRI